MLEVSNTGNVTHTDLMDRKISEFPKAPWHKHRALRVPITTDEVDFFKAQDVDINADKDGLYLKVRIPSDFITVSEHANLRVRYFRWGANSTTTILLLIGIRYLDKGE